MRLGFVAACLLVLVDAAVQAQPARGPALNWTRQAGAESCIASIELAARIEARVGQPIFVRAPDAIVAVEGSVQPGPDGGYLATIAVSDGKGTLYGSRELRTANHCRELDDALVLVIAVTLRPQDGYLGGIALPEDVAQALDRLFGAEPVEPDPAAFPSDAAKLEAARQQAATPRAAASSEAERGAVTGASTQAQAQAEAGQLWLEAAAFAQLGVTPALSGGAAIGARWVSASFGGVGLRAGLSLPSTRDVIDAGERSEVRFSTLQLALEYCTPALAQSGALSLRPCAAARAGALQASGVGFSAANGRRSELWVAADLLARAQWDLGSRLALALSAGPELYVWRPQLVYAASDGSSALLHRVPTVGAVGELSLLWRAF